MFEQDKPQPRTKVSQQFDRLSESAIGEGLQKLMKKDMVIQEKGKYQVADSITEDKLEELRPPKI